MSEPAWAGELRALRAEVALQRQKMARMCATSRNFDKIILDVLDDLGISSRADRWFRDLLDDRATTLERIRLSQQGRSRKRKPAEAG